MNVAVLGASPKPDRYSNKAIKMLIKHGHTVFPVAPKYESIENLKCFSSLLDIEKPIDTISLYIGHSQIHGVIEDIVKCKPRRVILNPGTEADILKKRLSEENIHFEEACTLVMLSTGHF